MKRNLLNIAVLITISSTVLSTLALPTSAYASELTANDNNSSNNKTTETYVLPGMGTGATAGAVVAGPVGLLVGGIIGAMLGSSQKVDSLAKDKDKNHTEKLLSNPTKQTKENIQLAQVGPLNTIFDDQSDTSEEKLMNILITDLSLDVYFRSGSTDIEKFYPARLSAIANLINSMDQLELHLDGYTDRRGNKSKNMTLANERIEKVRQQLISAGVENHRIISKAFGEKEMVSNAGDLDAYIFDRKVVIRFERKINNSVNSITTALSDDSPDVIQKTSRTNINPELKNISNRF